MAHVANLIIDNTKVAADLTDFPVFVDLSDMPAVFWRTVSNGGGDIRVYKSDGTTELPREVVACDTSLETGELHFKFSGTLSGSVDTTVQIHADGTSTEPAEDATYGRENVWKTNYKLVHHMQTTGALDSTSNDNDGTLTNMDSGNLVAGKLPGKGYDFNGTDESVVRGADDAELDFEANPFTISMWLNSDVDSPNFLSKKNADVDGGYELFNNSGTTTFRVRQSGANKDYTKSALIAAVDGWSLFHFVGSPGTGGDIYKNGVSISLTADAGTYTSIQNTGNVFMYGRAQARGYYNGQMDELRVLNGEILSANWITTEYNNQNSPSTFYTAERANISITETSTLTETIAVNKAIITTITETLSLVETATFIRTLLLSILETLSLKEYLNASKWIKQDKGSDTWSGETKPTTTFTKESKGSSTWTEKSK